MVRIINFTFLVLLSVNISSYASLPLIWFNDVDSLMAKSESIIIAKCMSSAKDRQKNYFNRPAKIKVLFILKGNEKEGTIEILTDRMLDVGKRYLLSSDNKKREYSGEFSAIPLDEELSLSSILAHDTLKEQLLYIFRWRIDSIKFELESLKNEKERLEELLTK